ncbi:MAG: heavy metal translocating P-type ATPase [Planctomycetota bacterium]
MHQRSTESSSDDHHHGVFGEATELVLAIGCGVALLTGWLSGFAIENAWVPLGFYLLAYLLGGFFITIDAFKKTIQGKFEIDFLMIVAALGAAALGAWAEGALLLFLFSLGHALEHYAMGRARKAIEALAELTPETALVRRDDQWVEVAIDDLKIGDVVTVKPNERLAADGYVIKGTSSIDQSPITGESVPVDKQPVPDLTSVLDSEREAPEHRVFAGTINQSGALEIVVTRLSSDSTLARVVTMVNEADSSKSKTQQFAVQFEKYFVPTVIGITVLLLFAFLVVDEPFSASFYRAMAVLVGASPCALAISTPSAVLSAVARAARGGVLVKGGRPLESLGQLEAIAFDKTGTLTEGRPRLIDVVTFNGASETELFQVAYAIESLSDHPLARAVVRDLAPKLSAADEQWRGQLPVATSLHSITGRGVEAIIDGDRVFAGKATLFDETDGPRLSPEHREQITRLEAEGRTTMVFRKADQYLGVLGLMDTPREHAQGVIRQLRDLGIKRMIMISGDNQTVASSVAKTVGLDEAQGDLMPDEKVAAIKALGLENGVAMVGDGVNDAPAMANATVGIAMGAAGSDVALETADVALMADDLRRLPFAVGLSRQTSRIIRQNLFFSLGMVVVLIPSAIFGLNIGLAVLFHEGSTIFVVVNALRLLVYRE